MAEAYSEDEQIQELKKWWQENGKSTVISVLVVLAGIFGWQSWQTQKNAEMEAGSMIYQNLLAAVSANNGQLNPSQLATARHLADTLKTDFPDSTYATYSALFNAQFAVNEKNLELAAEELNWALSRDMDADLRKLAGLRLARVYSAQEKYDDALALLAIDAGVYAASYEEVMGDIYKAQGQLDKALLSYQKAQQLSQQAEQPVANGVLSLKLDHLAKQLTAVDGDS